MSGDLVLGVDGGGTKTQALVADRSGTVLARGLGGGSNYHRIGAEKARQGLLEAIRGALNFVVRGQSGGTPWSGGRIAAACFGLSGIDSVEDEAVVSEWIRAEQIAPLFSVVNDTELILAAGTPEGWGVALVSGTGSNCIARSREGRKVRVGGWGSLLGDEGSGFYITERAMRLAAQTHDGRADAKGLLRAVLAQWKVASIEALIPKVYGPEVDEGDIAALAGTVLDLAGRGDEQARSIVEEAARDLARHVDTAIRRLDLRKPHLALAGGLLLRRAFQQQILGEVKSETGGTTYVTQPAQGAVTLARRLLEAGPPRA